MSSILKGSENMVKQIKQCKKCGNPNIKLLESFQTDGKTIDFYECTSYDCNHVSRFDY